MDYIVIGLFQLNDVAKVCLFSLNGFCVGHICHEPSLPSQTQPGTKKMISCHQTKPSLIRTVPSQISQLSPNSQVNKSEVPRVGLAPPGEWSSCPQTRADARYMRTPLHASLIPDSHPQASSSRKKRNVRGYRCTRKTHASRKDTYQPNRGM